MQIHIAGSGPVALASALFLKRQGVCFSSTHSSSKPLPAAVASRAIALSAGSCQLLSRIIELPPGGEILTVDVAVLGHGLHLRMHASDLRLPALGRVVRYGDLLDALHIASRSAPAKTGESSPDSPQLTVLADGGQSDGPSKTTYPQSAVLADIQIDPLDTHGVAWERFKNNGPIALLPLNNSGRYNLVWCEDHQRARQLFELPANEFCQQLEQTLERPFDTMALHGERQIVPLSFARRDPAVNQHTVAIGNAAQILHPVAGQGLNLGLRDAFVMSQCVGDAVAAGHSVRSCIEDIAKQRKYDQLAIVQTTDALARMAGADAKWAMHSPALNALLIGMSDLFPRVRKSIANRFIFGHRG